MSQVTDNMMARKEYAPYCGAFFDPPSKCSGPRAPFNGSQFECPDCGWKSDLDDEFIAAYKAKWKIK